METRMTLDHHTRSERAKVTPELRREVYRRYKGICQLCLEPVGSGWHLDHIRPLFLWGNTVLANVQVTHDRCNRRKGSRVFGWGAFLTIFTMFELYGGQWPAPEQFKEPVRPVRPPELSPIKRSATVDKPLVVGVKTDGQQFLPFSLDAYFGGQIPLGAQ